MKNLLVIIFSLISLNVLAQTTIQSQIMFGNNSAPTGGGYARGEWFQPATPTNNQNNRFVVGHMSGNYIVSFDASIFRVKGLWDSTKVENNPLWTITTDNTGRLWKYRSDSLKIHPYQLASPVSVSKGGTGLSNSGTAGQVVMSNGSGFTMTNPVWQKYSDTLTWDATKNWVLSKNYLTSFSEIDPIWNVQKSDYLKKLDSSSYATRFYLINNHYTKGQSDARYLQSYTESDPIWSGVAASYRTKTQNDLLYYPLSGNPSEFLTSFTETDPSVPAYSKTLNGFSVIKTSTDALYQPLGSYITVEVDGSVTNELQTVSGSNRTFTLSNSGGSVTIRRENFDSLDNKPVTLIGYGITDAQNTLVSGTNIKTIETQSLMGSGNIDLNKSDVGLTNVDNTSDANKPISTATQTALNTKQNILSLTTTGTTGAATLTGNTINIPNYSASGAVGADSRAGYGTGTVYSLTGSSAKITMGTTSPTVTLPNPGTYMIISNLKLDYAGLTTLGISTASFKLRRTNNTATDLPNATASFTSPIVTLLTGPAGDADLQGVLYTTSTSGDIIEMWGNRGASISLGNINVSEAWIMAIRIY